MADGGLKEAGVVLDFGHGELARIGPDLAIGAGVSDVESGFAH